MHSGPSESRALSVLDHGLAATASLLTEAFADYFVPLKFSPATLAGMARLDSVDLAASRVWFDRDQPVATLLHSSRGWTGRLAGMAVLPSARKRGIGKKAVTSWIEESRQRGLRFLVLEVITANEPACRLYERLGFQRVQRLCGWNGNGISGAGAGELSRVDPREMAALLAQRDTSHALPWQIAPETVAQVGPPSSAWRHGEAMALVSDLSASTVALRSLTWPAPVGHAAATRLLELLAAQNPDRTWRAPAVYPESWAPVFTAAGWTQDDIAQWQMALSL